MDPVLKTGEWKRSGGSNPSLFATYKNPLLFLQDEQRAGDFRVEKSLCWIVLTLGGHE